MKTAKKAILTVLSVAALAALSILLWNVFRLLMTEEGRQAFKINIMNMGAWGVLALIGLCASQVFLFFLPGEPMELLAGMCYGAVGGLLIIYAGVLLSGGIIFFLVRKLGKTSVYDFIGEKTAEKIEQNRFLQSGKAETLLLLLFVPPGTPKDLLLYIGAFTTKTPKRFLVLSTLFRFPSIITSTVVGASFAKGNTLFAVIVYAATFLVSLLLMRYYSKKETVREILDVKKD